MNKNYLVIAIYFTLFQIIYSYSAIEDARIIREYLRAQKPEPPKDHAKVARTLVHKSNWAATGTISTSEKIQGFPMVNIISISDSAKNAPSTGDIYFFLTMLDFTGQDIKKDNKITFLISNDEDLSCTHNNHTDPMEPTCPRVILSGNVIELIPGTKEYDFGEKSFISRHPAAKNWLKAHTFFLCKLKIENIFVLDWYGGPHDVSIQDYYKASPDDFVSYLDKYVNNEVKLTSNETVNIKINRKRNSIINIEV